MYIVILYSSFGSELNQIVYFKHDAAVGQSDYFFHSKLLLMLFLFTVFIQFCFSLTCFCCSLLGFRVYP